MRTSEVGAHNNIGIKMENKKKKTTKDIIVWETGANSIN